MQIIEIVDGVVVGVGQYPDRVIAPVETFEQRQVARDDPETGEPATAAVQVAVTTLVERAATLDDFFPADQRDRFRVYAGEVAIGWLWDAAHRRATAPPPPDMARIRASALAQVVAYVDHLTSPVTSRYADAESSSWPTQEAEARAVQSGAGATAAPLISQFAADAGVTLSVYAAGVLTKAAQFRSIVAFARATREQAETAIGAAQDSAAVATALSSIKAAATARAAELGLA